MDKKGWEYQVFLSMFFLSDSAGKFRSGTLLCCVSETFPQQKKWIRRGSEGISSCSVENNFSDSAEKFRRGTLQCVINFGYRKKLGFRGLCNDFLSRIFCLTVTKHIVGEPFCVLFQKTSGSDKSLCIEGRGMAQGVSRFSTKIFLSHSAE